MSYTIPTATDFQARFRRDFPFAAGSGSDDFTRVTDVDINLAITQAGFNFPSRIPASQAQFSELYLLKAAHHLCMNMLAATQGLRGQGEWAVIAKGVDGVNASFSIPEKIMSSPAFVQLSKTIYGAQYLEIIAPHLIGGVFSICGATTYA
jgi:hypothetical protein